MVEKNRESTPDYPPTSENASRFPQLFQEIIGLKTRVYGQGVRFSKKY